MLVGFIPSPVYVPSFSGYVPPFGYSFIPFHDAGTQTVACLY